MRDVAIIGAGPYGLSLAAHLQHAGIDHAIFGKPMDSWINGMPKGMHLKSEGFASNLYDPENSLPLSRYCHDHNLPYEDIGLPVPLETFVNYGLEFQRRFAPHLDERLITTITPRAGGFLLQTKDGEVAARRVVVASGIHQFTYTPRELALNLPPDLLSHSADHSDLSHFNGKRVLVIGLGASAIDLAVLLHQNDAQVTVIGRQKMIRYVPEPPPQRSWKRRLGDPVSGLGTGWKTFFLVNAAGAFHHLPYRMRMKAINGHLGPAPGWFVRDYVKQNIPVEFGVEIEQAGVTQGEPYVQVRQHHASRTFRADHIIAATGYHVDIERLHFLRKVRLINTISDAPILSSHFESSVPGLYFTGITALSSFGSLMRFAYGANFAAKRVSSHLSRQRRAVANASPSIQMARQGSGA